jgi:hypothetical protein
MTTGKRTARQAEAKAAEAGNKAARKAKAAEPVPEADQDGLKVNGAAEPAKKRGRQKGVAGKWQLKSLELYVHISLGFYLFINSKACVCTCMHIFVLFKSYHPL